MYKVVAADDKEFSNVNMQREVNIVRFEPKSVSSGNVSKVLEVCKIILKYIYLIFSFGADKQNVAYHDDGIKIARRGNRRKQQ
jgi:hypothetical protein